MTTMDLRRVLRENWRWLIVLSFLALLPTKNLFNVPVVVMALGGIVTLVRGGLTATVHSTLTLLLGLFACIWIPMLTALPDAANFEHTMTTTLKFLRFPLMGIFMLVALADHTSRTRLFWGIFLILLAWCLDALWQFVTGSNFLGYPLHSQRLNGVFHPKYRLGIVLAAFLPLFLELIRRLAERWKAAWLLVPLVVVIIVLSGSRAGWIMLVLALVLYTGYLAASGVMRSFLNTRSMVVVALVVVATAAAVNHYPPTAHRARAMMGLFSSDLEVVDAATKRRVSIWIPALDIAGSHWVNGIGPRGFRYEFVTSADEDNFWMKREPPGVTHPHMHALEILTETGTIGVAGYLLFFGLWLRLLLGRPMVPGVRVPAGLCVLVAMFPLNVHMAFYASFWSSVCWWLVFLALAVLGPNRSGRSPETAVKTG